jgi:hypothetical protein
MWVSWTDGKPKRIAFSPDNKPKKGAADRDSVKHAWGLIVWNYKSEAIEVFELDKQGVIASLTIHAKDADWGHPKDYDIVITKKGSGTDTEYSFVAKPKKPISEEIKDAYLENPIDLDQLLTESGSPFLEKTAGAPPAKEPDAPKVVTPENWVSGDALPAGHVVDGDGIKKKALPF